MSCLDSEVSIEIISNALILFSTDRIILLKFFPEFKCYVEVLDQDFEGDSPPVTVFADGNPWLDGTHHLPGDQGDTHLGEKLIKILILLECV